jgi:hypothetical protein
MLDKPMMRVWLREWAEEVKKGIVEDDEIFEYRVHYVEPPKDMPDKKTE